MSELSKKLCVPCRGGDSPLSPEEISAYLRELPDWERIEVKGVARIRKRFRFRNFREALAFTDEVGRLAEEQNHHPRIVTQWGAVAVDWWTHVIGGLHENDFIMAARCDQLLTNRDS
ncbi:MAG: 4a-hydroxytetrahydrobiopterin dehydratase [Alkalispirochaeta sp.]